jgi:uncharacterized protein (TIGR00730 family)
MSAISYLRAAWPDLRGSDEPLGLRILRLGARRAPSYSRAARDMGTALARAGLTLVYGGGKLGLMGIVADAVLGGRGRVVGVIPRMLIERECAHPSLTTQHVVDTMHERKTLMADMSDAFVGLPGGMGTFDELIEIVTWAQLGLHAKPVSPGQHRELLRALYGMLDHAVQEKFVTAKAVRAGAMPIPWLGYGILAKEGVAGEGIP